MRITNVISNLGSGGAEHVMELLSDLWVKSGKHVEVVTRSYAPLSVTKISLNPAIYVTSVVASEVSKHWPPRTKKLAALIALRKAIVKTRPDVVVSYMDTVSVETLLALAGTGIPVIVAEHCDPNTRPLGMHTVCDASRGLVPNRRSQVYGFLRPFMYSRAFSVVCLTETAMSFFSPRIQKKGRIIPNPVFPPPVNIPEQCTVPKNIKRLISLCRFSDVKGLDFMLTAFSKVAEKHPDARLELWGEGSLEHHLKQLSRDLGIQDRVLFPGWTYNPHDVLQGATLFVMSSKTEGFPMALCQAMACGVPAVSFDCPSGPRHIIRDGIDGILVPNGDVASLASAMDRLLTNEHERARLAEQAPEILQRFSVERVLDMWELLLSQAFSQKKWRDQNSLNKNKV